jgi:hypothetical protein
METYFHNSGQSMTSVNGHPIDKHGWNMDWDGKNTNLMVQDNNDLYYTKLNNKDIVNILKIPSHKLTLDKRLEKITTKGKRKTTKGKTTKGKTKKTTKGKTKKTTKGKTKKTTKKRLLKEAIKRT